MHQYSVDMESSTDPYGTGIGFVIQVLAKSTAEAREKAVKAWPTHPYNREGWYTRYKPFKVTPSKLVVI